jgi:UDP:flavonoid glycosyltransferase YjiC (YdhE family)
VEEAGAGIMLLQPDRTSLRAAIERALAAPEIRAAAARVAQEMSLMPSVDDAIREIDRLHARSGNESVPLEGVA